MERDPMKAVDRFKAAVKAGEEEREGNKESIALKPPVDNDGEACSLREQAIIIGEEKTHITRKQVKNKKEVSP